MRPPAYGWQCVPGRELNKLITLGQKEYFTAYHKCVHPLTDKGLESRFDLASATRCARKEDGQGSSTWRAPAHGNSLTSEYVGGSVLQCASSSGRLTLHAGDNLGWVDEAQRNQQPHQCGEHVDYRHGIDRLPCPHARRIDRVIERDHERLAPRPSREECQLEHRYGAHQYEQQSCENTGCEQRHYHVHEQPSGAGAEHARGGFNTRINLLDERYHHQHHEWHRGHKISEDYARHIAAEVRLIEHGGKRDAEGDRRDE